MFIVLAINELTNSRLAKLKPMPKEIKVADIASLQTHDVNDDYSYYESDRSDDNSGENVR